MICQLCNQRKANTHVKKTVNGKTTEFYVCADCAKKQGIGLTSHPSVDMGNIFGALFAQPVLREPDEALQCPQCQKTFREIVQSGKVGCSQCYVTFYERLQPSIQRIHGKTTHVGKKTSTSDNAPVGKSEIERLKEELSSAIERQEYELCATLRDQIRALEGEENE